ncbi:hypothetical protein NKDENANG_04001 [Candidatus Entotheonellaceae bacterium PAL068K]
MVNRTVLLMVIVVTCIVANTAVARTPSPPGAVAYIISPSHGEVVRNPVTVRFGLQGMGVAPVGVDKPKTGHHHLLIDVTALPSMGIPIPADANHKHFGGGQTETTIELTPGKHTLQLLLGDMHHIPHDPPVFSESITIIVQ